MDAEEAALRRRRALADSLTQQSLTPQQNMLSPASIWGPIAQALAGAAVSHQVGQQEDTYAKDKAAAMASILGGGASQAPAPMPSAPADPLTSAVSGVPMQPPPAQAAGPTPPPNMYGRNAGLVGERDAMLANSEARTQSVGQPLYNPARPPPGSVPGIPGRWDEGLSPPTGRINPNVGGPMNYQSAAARALASPYGDVRNMAVPLASLAQAQAQEGRFDATQRQQIEMQRNTQSFAAEQQARQQAFQAQMQAAQQAQQAALAAQSQGVQVALADKQLNRPVQLSPGATLLDPRTQQPIYTAPQAPNAGLPPSAITGAMLENVNSVRKIDDALGLLEKPEGQAAVGIRAGLTPDFLLQRTDPNGTSVRALIADIGSLKIHDRSGAAVSASEFPRLVPFIPKVSDDPKTIQNKLANFRKEYESVLRDQYSIYGPQGGGKPLAPVEEALTRRAQGGQAGQGGGWSIRPVQ